MAAGETAGWVLTKLRVPLARTPSSLLLLAPHPSYMLLQGTRHMLSTGMPTWRRPSQKQPHRGSLTW